MSFVITAPGTVADAASDLASIGSAITAAHAAATPTTALIPAAADEVSTAISGVFGSYAQAYQALSAQAAAFHIQFVNLVSGGAQHYAATEAASVSPLVTVTNPPPSNPPPTAPPPTPLQTVVQDVNTVINTVVQDGEAAGRAVLSYIDPWAGQIKGFLEGIF